MVMHSIVFVLCVHLCVISVYTLNSQMSLKRTHTAHSSTFMSPEMFARSIELYTECCFPHLYSRDCLPGVPGVSAGIFQNIILKASLV